MLKPYVPEPGKCGSGVFSIDMRLAEIITISRVAPHSAWDPLMEAAIDGIAGVKAMDDGNIIPVEEWADQVLCIIWCLGPYARMVCARLESGGGQVYGYTRDYEDGAREWEWKLRMVRNDEFFGPFYFGALVQDQATLSWLSGLLP